MDPTSQRSGFVVQRSKEFFSLGQINPVGRMQGELRNWFHREAVILGKGTPHTLAGLVRRHSDALRYGFENAIRVSDAKAVKLALPNAPQEPDLVATLVTDGTPLIASEIERALRRYGVRVSVTSVFCHQKPLVRHSGGTCELGDILFVHAHRTVGGTTTFNSLLLQAKLSARSNCRVHGADRVQLGLYVDWPAFTYLRAGPLTGVTRDVHPKAAHAGAQYLLMIDSRSGLGRVRPIPPSHSMSVSPASCILTASTSLAYELVRMLEGNGGRPFLSEATADPTGWSQVVWDLLQMTRNAAFNRRRIGAIGSPRRVTSGSMLGFVSGGVDDVDAVNAMDNRFEELLRAGGRHPPSAPAREVGGEDGGVSTIVIQTGFD